MEIYLFAQNREILQELKKAVNEVVVKEKLDLTIKACVSNEESLLKKIDAASQNLYIIYASEKELLSCIDIGKRIYDKDKSSYILLLSEEREKGYLIFKYKIQLTDYILVNDEEILEEQLLSSMRYIIDLNVNDMKKYLVYNKFSKKQSIAFTEIVAIRVSPKIHYSEIVCDYGVLQIKISLSKIMTQLDERFVRGSKSVLINCDKVTELNKKEREVIMNNGEHYEVSIRGCRSLLKGLKEY